VSKTVNDSQLGNVGGAVTNGRRSIVWDALLVQRHLFSRELEAEYGQLGTGVPARENSDGN